MNLSEQVRALVEKLLSSKLLKGFYSTAIHKSVGGSLKEVEEELYKLVDEGLLTIEYELTCMECFRTIERQPSKENFNTEYDCLCGEEMYKILPQQILTRFVRHSLDNTTILIYRLKTFSIILQFVFMTFFIYVYNKTTVYKNNLAKGGSYMKKYSNPLFFGLAIYEGFMAIPIVGALFVIGYGWTPLTIAFFLHVIALILSVKEGRSKAPSILGMITSVIAIVPFVGMIMHFITAITYLVSAVRYTRNIKRIETSIF